MKLSNEEVKKILGTGFKLILDRSYTPPRDKDFSETISRFVKHRNLLTELKSALDTEGVTAEELKGIIDKQFGHVAPFKYVEEKHDCDNAAIEAMAWLSGKNYPAGLAIIEGHALLVYINDKRERVFVDQYTGHAVQINERLKVTVIG